MGSRLRRPDRLVDSLVVCSPHLDDACLSAGQFLAGRPDAHLVTVFAGMPHDLTMSTEFDRNSGFTSAGEAVTARRAEDERAAARLHAYPVHLPYVDGQYRDDGLSPDALVDSLFEALDRVHQRTLLAPVGIVHPDHVAVSDAAVLTLTGADVDVVLYEELPGRVLWPECAAARLATLTERLGPLGLRLEQVFIGTGPMAAKARAVDEYRSQRWALNRRCLFVPERFWRVVSCD